MLMYNVLGFIKKKFANPQPWDFPKSWVSKTNTLYL